MATFLGTLFVELTVSVGCSDDNEDSTRLEPNDSDYTAAGTSTSESYDVVETARGASSPVPIGASCVTIYEETTVLRSSIKRAMND